MKHPPQAPLVAHVIHHLGTGGMENGLVNLINRTPPARFRHAIVALTDAGPFAERITRSDVPIVCLHRQCGPDVGLYWRVWRALRQLRPSLVHTRNLAALEAQIPAFFVPGVRRVHGEHGRDVFDLHGASRRYNLLRRVIRPLVHRYVAVSHDLSEWLIHTVGASPARVRQIYNGVDQTRFHPRAGSRPALAPDGLIPDDPILIGTVGRLAAVKDQLSLVRAFAVLVRERPEHVQRLRLVIVGDGPLRADLEAAIDAAGLKGLVWLPGDRQDVPELLRMLDLFVLPSLGEGISNTILEAMATRLPVIATRVGGNPELVDDGRTGTLVPPGAPAALAAAIRAYLEDPGRLAAHGAAGLAKVREHFRWERCVDAYLAVYDELLGEPAALPLGAGRVPGNDA